MSNSDELLDEVERIANATRYVWVPSPKGEPKEHWKTEDKVAGIVTAIWETPSKQGGMTPVYDLLTREGDIAAVYVTRSVLRSEFEQSEVKVGDAVVVSYLGLVEREPEANYHRYRVVVRHADQPAAQPAVDDLPPAQDDDPPVVSDDALALVAHGYNVLPIRAGSKRPAVASWKRWETEQQTEDWVRENVGQGNLAITTGVASNVVVLDADDGAARDFVIAQVGGKLERTPIARSGREGGGFHFYFARPNAERVRSVKIREGMALDVKADGGYVLVPPSIHPDTGRPYEWVVSPFDKEPIPLPGGLVEALWPPAKVIPFRPRREPGKRMNRYAEAAMDAETKAVRFAPVGERNETLNRAAFSLSRFVHSGELDGGYVFELLLMAAVRNGLSEVEARRTIRSGLAAREA